MKKALITGVLGQDGRYLSQFLLAKGYEIIGVASQREGIEVSDGVRIEQGNITDAQWVNGLVRTHQPDEIYNLAAVTSVEKPWDDVPHVLAITGMAPLFFLEAIREQSPRTRLFQASSAEMFGTPTVSPQKEETPFVPRNPYGIAKEAAHRLCGGYRSAHKLFATSGILYTHESPRRAERFLSRKVTASLARIALKKQEMLTVGNLNAQRDWGYAKEYVEAMWMMLQKETPDDFIIATGKLHTVRDLIEAAGRALEMELRWEGEGKEEKGYTRDGTCIVAVNPEFFRPTEEVPLMGDTTKAKHDLGWEAHTSFEDLIALMVKADYDALAAT